MSVMRITMKLCFAVVSTLDINKAAENVRLQPLQSQLRNPNLTLVIFPQLLHLGRDYPQGYDFFRTRLKRAFIKNRDVQEPEKIKTMIKHGEYVIKELEALYMLKKYRTLKRRYYNEPVAEKIKADLEQSS